MNRRELLRELSRVQATWVNRNTPGSGDVNVTAEQEQDYLTRISAVIERAREDVRRKRSPILSADAMAATQIIAALMAGFDKDQARDQKGRWSEREGSAPSPPSVKPSGGVPVAKPRPKPEPAKAMTPESTLSAAPKAVDGTGSRKVDRAGTAALERYRGKDFSEINRGLRSGKPSAKTSATAAQIDRVHADSKLTEDVVVHRGIGDIDAVFGPAAKRKLIGAEWQDDAFQSTSANADTAERFLIGEQGRRGVAVMKIRVPKGTGAIQLSDDRYEAEMLLERGLRMRVVSDTGPWRRGQKRPRTIEVEVVPA